MRLDRDPRGGVVAVIDPGRLRVADESPAPSEASGEDPILSKVGVGKASGIADRGRAQERRCD